MSAHAIISPSGAHRWLECTPSARLEQEFEDKTSEAADEGTLFHAIGELLILRKLGRVTKKHFDDQIAKAMANKHYDAPMMDYAEDYSVFVIEKYNEVRKTTPDAEIFVEYRFDLTKWIPEGFGTGDVSIVGNGMMIFIDAKYGKGVYVEVTENKQLMTYSLGALEAFGWLYDIKSVQMWIYQPRIDNIDSFEMTADGLRQWGDTKLRPMAEKAFRGEGEYKPGDHCKFCRAKGECKALAGFNLELAKYEFKHADLMEDEQIADIITRYKMFTDWIKAVYDQALKKAIDGYKYPGYKVVYGRSIRRYSDPNAALELLKEKNFDLDDIAPRKLLNLTKMQKELGKDDFDTYLSPLLIKPKGKPTLAAENDKRETYDKSVAAAEDFADIDDDD